MTKDLFKVSAEYKKAFPKEPTALEYYFELNREKAIEAMEKAIKSGEPVDWSKYLPKRDPNILY